MVNVKIVPTTTSPEGAPSGNLKIKIMSEEPKPISVELLARRALNGDVMILDHDLVDIIISPTKTR